MRRVIKKYLNIFLILGFALVLSCQKDSKPNKKNLAAKNISTGNENPARPKVDPSFLGAVIKNVGFISNSGARGVTLEVFRNPRYTGGPDYYNFTLEEDGNPSNCKPCSNDPGEFSLDKIEYWSQPKGILKAKIRACVREDRKKLLSGPNCGPWSKGFVKADDIENKDLQQALIKKDKIIKKFKKLCSKYIKTISALYKENNKTLPKKIANSIKNQITVGEDLTCETLRSSIYSKVEDDVKVTIQNATTTKPITSPNDSSLNTKKSWNSASVALFAVGAVFTTVGLGVLANEGFKYFKRPKTKKIRFLRLATGSAEVESSVKSLIDQLQTSLQASEVRFSDVRTNDALIMTLNKSYLSREAKLTELRTNGIIKQNQMSSVDRMWEIISYKRPLRLIRFSRENGQEINHQDGIAAQEHLDKTYSERYNEKQFKGLDKRAQQRIFKIYLEDQGSPYRRMLQSYSDISRQSFISGSWSSYQWQNIDIDQAREFSVFFQQDGEKIKIDDTTKKILLDQSKVDDLFSLRQTEADLNRNTQSLVQSYSVTNQRAITTLRDKISSSQEKIASAIAAVKATEAEKLKVDSDLNEQRIINSELSEGINRLTTETTNNQQELERITSVSREQIVIIAKLEKAKEGLIKAIKKQTEGFKAKNQTSLKQLEKKARALGIRNEEIKIIKARAAEQATKITTQQATIIRQEEIIKRLQQGKFITAIKASVFQKKLADQKSRNKDLEARNAELQTKLRLKDAEISRLTQQNKFSVEIMQRRINSLETHSHATSSENNSLRQKVIDLEANQSQLRQQLLDSQRDLAQKTLELGDKGERLSALNAQVAKTQADLVRQMAELEASQRQVTTLTSSKEKLQKTESSQSIKINELKGEVTRIRREKEKYRTQTETIEQDLRAQIATLTRKGSAQKNEINIAQESLRTKTKELTEKQKELARLQNQVADLSSSAERSSSEMQNLKEQLSSSQRSVTRLEASVESLKKQNLRIYEKLGDKNRQIKNLVDQLRESQKNTRQTQASLDAKTKEASRLTSENQRLQQNIRDLESRAKTSAEDYARSLEVKQREVTEAQQKIKELEASLAQQQQQQRQEVESLTQGNSAISKALSKAVVTNQSISQAQRSLEVEKAQLEETIAANKNTIRVLEANLQSKDTTISSIKQNLQEQLDKLQRKTKELAETTAEKASLQREQEANRRKTAELTKNLETKSRELASLTSSSQEKISQKEIEIEYLNSKVSQLTANNQRISQDLQDKTQEMQRKNNELISQNEELRKANLELVEHNRTLQMELASAQNELKIKERQLILERIKAIGANSIKQKQRAEIDRLRAENDQLRRNNTTFEAEVEDLKKSRSSFEAENLRVKGDYDLRNRPIVEVDGFSKTNAAGSLVSLLGGITMQSISAMAGLSEASGENKKADDFQSKINAISQEFKSLLNQISEQYTKILYKIWQYQKNSR